MPELGNIKKGYEIGRVSSQKCIWHACESCGKQRWVSLISGNPQRLRCYLCSRPRGKNNHFWKGGRHLELGYVFITIQPDNPYYCMSNAGQLQEHRYVMAQHLGRPLEWWEIVDHRNESRSDNRIENLDLVTLHENLQLQKMRRHLRQLESQNNDLYFRIIQFEAELSLLKTQVEMGYANCNIGLSE